MAEPRNSGDRSHVGFKILLGVLVSAILTGGATTMANRLGMPTCEHVGHIVTAEIGAHSLTAHPNAATHAEVAAAVGAVRRDIQDLTFKVGQLVGQIGAVEGN